MMQVLFTLEGLGLTVGILRVVALEGLQAGRAVLGMSLAAVAAMTAGLVASSSSWAEVFGFGNAHEALLLTVLWSGFSACTWVSVALARAADRLAAVLVVDAIQLAGTQALGLAFAATASDRVTAYLLGVAIAQAVALAAGLCYVRPVVRFWRYRMTLGRALAFSLPVLPLALSTFVLSASDRLVISRDLGPAAVGRYQIAYGLACVALILVGALGTQWLPSLLQVRATAARQRAITAARDRLAVMLVPTVLGLSAGIPEVLRFWVGGSYDVKGLTVVVATVAVSTIPFTLYTCHQLVLLAEGSTSRIAMIMVVSALANVLLNVILVPLLGINGSAYATLLAYAVLWVCTALVTRGAAIGPSPSPRTAGVLVLASGLAGLSLLLPITGVGGTLRWCLVFLCVVALAQMARAAGRGLPDHAPVAEGEPAGA